MGDEVRIHSTSFVLRATLEGSWMAMLRVRTSAGPWKVTLTTLMVGAGCTSRILCTRSLRSS